MFEPAEIVRVGPSADLRTMTLMQGTHWLVVKVKTPKMIIVERNEYNENIARHCLVNNISLGDGRFTGSYHEVFESNFACMGRITYKILNNRSASHLLLKRKKSRKGIWLMVNSANNEIDFINALTNTLPKHFKNEDYFFVCIGTDRSSGDSLGPFVGTYLQEKGYTNLIGTIDDPVHALNLTKRLEEVPKDKIIIAIDACLSNADRIGLMTIDKGSLKPGSALNKDLPPVGHFHISGIVNVKGFMEHIILQNTRLSLVIKMAKSISSGIDNHMKIVQRRDYIG